MKSVFVGLLLVFISLTITFCKEASSFSGENRAEPEVEDSLGIVYPKLSYSWMTGKTFDTTNNLYARMESPNGFHRIKTESGSFGEWLRFLPLHAAGKNVLLHNGEKKSRQDVHAAVVNIDPGKADLQQCADAVMRLRAEYLFSIEQYDKIHFNYTSGDKCDYREWSEGKRLVVSGNSVKKASGENRTALEDHSSFRSYLNNVFMFAGTLSLNREMKSISVDSMQIGDVFIYGGSPGHAVIVVDMCVNEAGDKMFMIAQSYMPAQEIHILKNLNDLEVSPWYPVKFGDVLETPEWEFEKTELKRFQGS